MLHEIAMARADPKEIPARTTLVPLLSATIHPGLVATPPYVLRQPVVANRCRLPPLELPLPRDRPARAPLARVRLSLMKPLALETDDFDEPIILAV